MDAMVERIPQVLQALFGQVSDDIARESGFVRRQRRFSGAEFVKTLVFGWLARPQASLCFLAAKLGLSDSALQQRMTPAASECLRLVFVQALAILWSTRRARIPLLARFACVAVEDCTTVSLPAALAEQFPGCGSNSPGAGKSALRLFTSYDVQTGRLLQVTTAPGRGSDAKIAEQHARDLPPGSLRLRDMGFFDRNSLARDTTAGVFWISRVPANLTLRTTETGPAVQLSEFLSGQPAGTQVDRWLWLGGEGKKGAQPLWCRLLAMRCPPDVAAERRRKVKETARRKGRTASQRQLLLCDWTVLITNLSADRLSFAEAWELYCVRWQIELLFKRWKSLGGLQVSTRLKPDRVLCELYAKLLGLLVAHWFTLIRGGPLEGFSLTRAVQHVQDHASQLAAALGEPQLLTPLVQKIALWLHKLPRQARRKKRRSTRQRLFRPQLRP